MVDQEDLNIITTTTTGTTTTETTTTETTTTSEEEMIVIGAIPVMDVVIRAMCAQATKERMIPGRMAKETTTMATEMDDDRTVVREVLIETE